jgi:O-antigen/teichoic acid export membrane protein
LKEVKRKKNGASFNFSKLRTRILIRPIIKRFKGSDFLRNTTILTSGTAVAQLISIFTAPVLTRIYLPADYGLLGIYLIFTALLGTFSTMQYHNAIVTAKDDAESKKVLELSVLINIITTGVSVLLVLIAGRWIAGRSG